MVCRAAALLITLLVGDHIGAAFDEARKNAVQR